MPVADVWKHAMPCDAVKTVNRPLAVMLSSDYAALFRTIYCHLRTCIKYVTVSLTPFSRVSFSLTPAFPTLSTLTTFLITTLLFESASSFLLSLEFLYSLHVKSPNVLNALTVKCPQWYIPLQLNHFYLKSPFYSIALLLKPVSVKCPSY